MFGRIIMAGRFGCAIVNDTMAAEEQVPGVSPAVMRAVRTAHTARLEADRRSREAQARAAAPPQRRPNYYHQQPTGNPAATQPTATPQQGVSQPQQQQQPTQAGPPVNGRMRYLCHSCNVRGHWARDDACRPEDVRTNLARLAAMLPSAQLALPQPGGSGTSRSSAILSMFSFLVFYKLQFLNPSSSPTIMHVLTNERTVLTVTKISRVRGESSSDFSPAATPDLQPHFQLVSVHSQNKNSDPKTESGSK
jgi:hypothetical protein